MTWDMTAYIKEQQCKTHAACFCTTIHILGLKTDNHKQLVVNKTRYGAIIYVHKMCVLESGHISLKLKLPIFQENT